MIFYFSATGNSKWVAQSLSSILNEDIISINEELRTSTNFSHSLADNEHIVFVFPVHSWGVPILVKNYIRRLNLENYTNQGIFAVCTCGDDAGDTNIMFKNIIEEKKWNFLTCFAVQMPNTYILLPGFNTDDEQIVSQKIKNAKQTIKIIAKQIEERCQNSNIYIRGSFPSFKTNVIYPLFNKFFFGKTKFQINNNCTNCGLCIKMCPTKNISLNKEKLLVWGNNCVQCLACLHSCPKQAINYGNRTQKKGRYKFNEKLIQND